jgi:hypothetical protein
MIAFHAIAAENAAFPLENWTYSTALSGKIMDYLLFLTVVLAFSLALILMELLFASVKIAVCQIRREDSLETAIGQQKGPKSSQIYTKSEDFDKGVTKLTKNVRHLSVFAARGNFYEQIGKENGSIFFIEDQSSGNMTYLFRVFGEEDDEICQYIGIFTGKLTKNISFLPGCEVVYVGHFPVEIGKFGDLQPGNVTEEILKMAELCGQAQLIEASTSVSTGQEMKLRENDDKRCSVAMANAALRFVSPEVRVNVVDTFNEWPFFRQNQIDDYLITFAVNSTQTAKGAEAILDNDHWFRENAGLHHMLGSTKQMSSGAMLILYPRNGGPEEIVGCAAVHPRPTRKPDGTIDLKITILISVWVCEELRHKGYGRKLVKKAASICKGPLITFLPYDDKDETFGALTFFRQCGCRNSVVDTSDYFGAAIEASIGPKMHRILILDDMSEST